MDTDADPDILRQVMARVAVAGGEPRCGELTGTKALMVAVLEDAIHDYCTAIGRQRVEVEGWVHSDGRDLFSFVVICETLGLEPAAVRRALAQPATHAALAQRRRRARHG